MGIVRIFLIIILDCINKNKLTSNMIMLIGLR